MFKKNMKLFLTALIFLFVFIFGYIYVHSETTHSEIVDSVSVDYGNKVLISSSVGLYDLYKTSFSVSDQGYRDGDSENIITNKTISSSVSDRKTFRTIYSPTVDYSGAENIFIDLDLNISTIFYGPDIEIVFAHSYTGPGTATGNISLGETPLSSFSYGNKNGVITEETFTFQASNDNKISFYAQAPALSSGEQSKLEVGIKSMTLKGEGYPYSEIQIRKTFEDGSYFLEVIPPDYKITISETTWKKPDGSTFTGNKIEVDGNGDYIPTVRFYTSFNGLWRYINTEYDLNTFGYTVTDFDSTKPTILSISKSGRGQTSDLTITAEDSGTGHVSGLQSYKIVKE